MPFHDPWVCAKCGWHNFVMETKCGDCAAPRPAALKEQAKSYAELMGLDEDGEPGDCTNPGGHEWTYTGTAYGGDDDRWQGEGRCYCIWCGADGDA